MVITEIEDFDSSEFSQCIDIYKSSFPVNETRSPNAVVSMLENDDNYHLFASLSDDVVSGISLLYTFMSLSVGLLDYMAVIPNYQRKGIGIELFNFTLEKLSLYVSNGIGLLMEIQKEDAPDPQEIVARKNRIKFYKIAGAKILDGVNYLLPPQNGSIPEEMYLMIRPLVEIPFLSKESVVQFIDAIYSRIYQYQNNDLLDKISQNLSATIMLRDIVM